MLPCCSFWYIIKFSAGTRSPLFFGGTVLRGSKVFVSNKTYKKRQQKTALILKGSGRKNIAIIVKKVYNRICIGKIAGAWVLTNRFLTRNPIKLVYPKGIVTVMEMLKNADFLFSGLSVYQALKKDPVISRYQKIIELLADEKELPPLHCFAEEYASFCAALYTSKFRGNLADYIYHKVLLAENFFTDEAAKGNFDTLPPYIQQAATHDLNALYTLAHITVEELHAAIAERYPEAPTEQLPCYVTESSRYPQEGCWGDRIAELAAYYHQNGTGIFSEEVAFFFDGTALLSVKNMDTIRLSDLKHYEVQRNKIIENTLSFLHGKPCNNILLYGDRGTGKSSTVKALLNEYHSEGLRIVQIEKKNLNSLGKLIDLLSDNPLRFIIFIDDLTFQENDEGFTALKACLEGSLSKKADNTVIYATSNRRHLVKETFSSREGDEVHRADTIDDSLSLSDRFGLTITFTVPDKAKYLDIVLKIAEDRSLPIDQDTLCRGAERFALQKAGRSPRIARQYIDQVQGRLEMGLPLI